LILPTVWVWAICLGATSFLSADEEGFAAASSAGKKAAQTSSKVSSKLRWLPYRPQHSGSEAVVTQTQHIVQPTPAAPAKSSQHTTSAFDDPFGDKNSPNAAQSMGVPEEPSSATPAGPGSEDSAPNFPDQTPATNSQFFNSQGKANGLPGIPNNFKGLNNQQTLEQALAQHPELSDVCPSVKDLKHISELGTNIQPPPGDLPRDCPWGGESFQPRAWAPVTFTWTASALCHKPLYFEDVQLERYGHMLGPWVQPFASGAHFFLTVPILPYKMGLELPNECMYTLGYYRPGSCTPYMLDPIPLSIRAGLFEAGAWVAGAAIIP
jgi:hypothetical protein